MRATLVACAAVAGLASLSACGSSTSSSSSSAASSSSTPTASSTSTSVAAGGGSADCAFKVTTVGHSVILGAFGAGAAVCAALKTQLGSQLGSASASTTIDSVDVSAATGTVVCSQKTGPFTLNVYADSGDTSFAGSFCSGFTGAASASSSTSS